MRAVTLRAAGREKQSAFPDVRLSPDAHALLVCPSQGAPAHVVLFE